jgi:hypothetical protein
MKGRELLTLQEARKIRDEDESNAAFKNTLKPGEWGFVRDSEVEARSRAAYLDLYRDGRRLFVNDYGRPDDAARVVVLKVVGSEAAAPESLTTKLRGEAKTAI